MPKKKKENKSFNSTGKNVKVNRSAFLALILLVIILILTAVIIIIQLPLFNNGKLEIAGNEEMAGIEALPLDAVDANNTYALRNNQILKIDEGILQIKDLQGNIIQEIEGSLLNPKIYSKDDYLLLVEQNGFHYYLFKNDELVFQNKTERAIISYSLSNDGKLALVTENEGTKGNVLVFSANGDILFKLTVQDNHESGYVLSTDFAADNKSIYISMLNISGALPQPIVNRYSLEAQNLAKITGQYKPNVNSSLPLIYSITEDYMVMAGAEAMIAVDQEKLRQPTEFNTFTNGGHIGKYFYFVASDNAGGPYYLNIVANQASFPGKATNGYELPDIPREINSAGNYIVLLIGDDIYRFVLTNPLSPDIFHMQGKVLNYAVDKNGDILCVCSNGVRKIVN